MKKIRLSEFIPSFWKLIKTYPKSNNVELILRNEASEAYVLSDVVVLQQILTNIITNSLKFTLNGSVTLKIFKNNSEKVVFEVRDTGIGMSEDFFKNKIFEPFEQEKEILKSGIDTLIHRGIGLGMPLSKILLEKIGGAIKITSKKGIGTTMYFELPITSPPNPKNTSSPKRHEEVFEDLSVLIVDDDAVNRKVMSQLLQKMGFKCWMASSGEEAIEFIRNFKGNTLSAVVMDIWMPGMGGLAATEEIRKLISRWEYPPLLVGCSADVSCDIRNECNKRGIRYFLPKPLDRQNLEEFRAILQKGNGQ